MYDYEMYTNCLFLICVLLNISENDISIQYTHPYKKKGNKIYLFQFLLFLQWN